MLSNVLGELNFLVFLVFIFWFVLGKRFFCKFFFVLFFFVLDFLVVILFLVGFDLFFLVLVVFFCVLLLEGELFLEMFDNVVDGVFGFFCLVCYCLCLLKFDGLLNFFGYFLYLNGWLLV